MQLVSSESNVNSSFKQELIFFSDCFFRHPLGSFELIESHRCEDACMHHYNAMGGECKPLRTVPVRYECICIGEDESD